MLTDFSLLSTCMEKSSAQKMDLITGTGNLPASQTQRATSEGPLRTSEPGLGRGGSRCIKASLSRQLRHREGEARDPPSAWHVVGPQ